MAGRKLDWDFWDDWDLWDTWMIGVTIIFYIKAKGGAVF